MDLDDDLPAIIVTSVSLAIGLVVWLRNRRASLRAASPRRQVRRMMGAGALVGAAALILVD